MDRGTWRAAVHSVTEPDMTEATQQQWQQQRGLFYLKAAD